MALIGVNAVGSRPQQAGGCADLDHVVRRTGGPIIIMLHGLKHTPGAGMDDPHRGIFALEPDRRAPRIVSWPRKLGITEHGDELAVGFGWAAGRNLWRAYQGAQQAGVALAALIRRLRAGAAGRPIQVIAHSLGARVLFMALPYLQRGDLSRAVLLSAAELGSVAQRQLRFPAGSYAEFINVTSRSNHLFDLMLTRAIAPFDLTEKGLGAGLPNPRVNWLDLPIDAAWARNALRALGCPIRPPAHRICHWSSYLTPGVFPFYRRQLLDPDGWPFHKLRAAVRMPSPMQQSRTVEQHPGNCSC